MKAEDADRIVRANFDVSGPTPDALMAAWRGMVYAMLERLELGEYRRDVIMLARDIVQLWSFVLPASTYEHDHQFSFPDARALGLIGFFEELHRLAMAVLLAAPELPPRDERERALDVESIRHIAEFAHAKRDAFQRMMRSSDCSYVRCAASALETSAACCNILIRVILGSALASEFQRQYDDCISAWTLAIPLVQEAEAS